jgi:hypothetical protein
VADKPNEQATSARVDKSASGGAQKPAPHQLFVHPHVTKLRQINLQHVTGEHIFFFALSFLFPYRGYYFHIFNYLSN